MLDTLFKSKIHNNVINYKKELDTDNIPYLNHVTDHIVSTRNGTYLTTFKIFGRTHECASEHDLNYWLKNINQMFKNIFTANYTVYVHLYRHELGHFKMSSSNLFFPKMFNEKYTASFEDKPLMINDWYLTLEYNPLADKLEKFFSFFEKTSQKEKKDIQEHAIQTLDRDANIILASLKSYDIRRLGFYYCNANGEIVNTIDNENNDINESLFCFSETLEFYNFLYNHKWLQVPVTKDFLYKNFSKTRLVASKYGDLIQLRYMNDIQYTVGLEIQDYESYSNVGHFNVLMESNFELLMSQSFVVFPTQETITHLRHQQKSLEEMRDPSTSQILQINEATDNVASKNFIMGWHYATVHVFDKVVETVYKKSDQIISCFNSLGFNVKSVKLASLAAYYTILPGNTKFAPRPALISSQNFLCFNSFHNFMIGKATGNPWGEAVMLLKNKSGTPLFFNFHVTPEDQDNEGDLPAGHTVMFGKTGSGKTTFLSALLINCTKYNPRMFIFDKDMGLYPTVKSINGYYIKLKDGLSSNWQPLQLESTIENIKFVTGLIIQLCEISLEGNLYHLEKSDIATAVESVMGEKSKIPREHRKLSNVMNFLQGSSHITNYDDRPSVRSLLSKWCGNGENAWLFDNDKDDINFLKNNIFAFDITDFVSTKGQKPPETRSPMLSYLFYRIRQSIDGKQPSLMVFDEFAQYLNDPVLEAEIKRGLKTDRKKNTVYLFCTQEANDTLESNIGKTISQSVVTKILLENGDAIEKDYREGLNLTESEFARFISIPENSREFMIKQGNKSAIATLDLSQMKQEINILSGDPVKSQILSHILEDVGEDVKDWLPIYYEKC